MSTFKDIIHDLNLSEFEIDDYELNILNYYNSCFNEVDDDYSYIDDIDD